MVGPRYDHFVMRQYQATDAVGGDARASLLPAARRAIVAGVNTWAVIAARYNFTDVWRQQRVLVGKFLGTKNPEPPTLDAEGLRIKIVADKRHDIDKKRDEEVRKMEETIFLRSRRSYAESAVVYTKLLGDLQEKVLKPKFLAYIKEATFAAEPAEHPRLRVWLIFSCGDFHAIEAAQELDRDEDEDGVLNALHVGEYEGSNEILVDFERLILTGDICEDAKLQKLVTEWKDGDKRLDVDEWEAFLPWLGVYAAAVSAVAKECGLQKKKGGRKVAAPPDDRKFGGGGQYLSYSQTSGFAEVLTFALGSS